MTQLVKLVRARSSAPHPPSLQRDTVPAAWTPYPPLRALARTPLHLVCNSSHPASPSSSPLTAPPATGHIATHTVRADPSVRAHLASFALPRAEQAQVIQQAHATGERIAEAINEEEQKLLGFNMDSTTDAGFVRVLMAAQEARDVNNAYGNEDGGVRRIVVRAFRFIDARQ